MAFRRSILFTRSQHLKKVNLEAPSSSNQAEIYFGLRFEMDGSLKRSHGRLEGKKTVESSILRERAGDRGLPGAEEKVFGPDWKRTSHEEVS